ncbi:hypothetical protein [Neobacillus niacini]|uniref:hypothetical protein n=1 Tax=Neobacillus niacini TaxID=86668 RepID=UPI00286A3BE2|nr:hypothetical protein [Neobacillus niacini]
MLEPLLEKVIENCGKPEAVAADAGYKTPAIAQYLIESEIRPALTLSISPILRLNFVLTSQ